MSDIRLETLPFELDGKTYQLRCNMNVLAEVQEAYGGDFGAALSEETSLKSVLHFLAAMLNDYADEMDWDERFTAKGLGRRLERFEVPAAQIMSLVIRAIVPPKTENETSKSDENAGN